VVLAVVDLAHTYHHPQDQLLLRQDLGAMHLTILLVVAVAVVELELVPTGQPTQQVLLLILPLVLEEKDRMQLCI
jgi:hypothetical protein